MYVCLRVCLRVCVTKMINEDNGQGKSYSDILNNSNITILEMHLLISGLQCIPHSWSYILFRYIKYKLNK